MEQKRNAPPRLMALFFFFFFSVRYSCWTLYPFQLAIYFFTRITKKKKREIYNFFVSFYDPTIMFILMACYLNRWSVFYELFTNRREQEVDGEKKKRKKRVYYNIHISLFFFFLLAGFMQRPVWRFPWWPPRRRERAFNDAGICRFFFFGCTGWWREDQWLPFCSLFFLIVLKSTPL